MIKALLNNRKAEVLPRIIIDFLLIQISALFALGFPILYATVTGNGAKAVELSNISLKYYLVVFIPLSLVFPAAFFLNGFYSSSHEERHRPWVVMRGVLCGALLFILGSYLLPTSAPAPPNIAVLCAVIVTIAATIRLVRAVVFKHVSIELKYSDSFSTRGQTVLVVGGAGYIGSTLVRRLLDAGYRVRILDSLIYGDAAIRDIMNHPGLELRVGDCRNIKSVVDAVRGVDSIVHLAAIVGDPACELDHNAAIEINYAATRMLIEVAKGHRIARFIFASSCSVYGATDQVVDESSPTVPLSVYARTKIDSEQAVLEACDDTFHPTIFRLATVFGNSYRPRFDLVVNLLTGRAYGDGSIVIYNGEQWRPFIHVADVARGIQALLDSPIDIISGQVFNLGDSRLNYTLADVAEKIRNEFPDTQVDHVDNSDRRNYRVSFDKARKTIGFTCIYDLDYGIRELKDALQRGIIGDYADARYNNHRYLQAQGPLATSAPIDAKVMAAFASTNTPEQAFTHA